MDFRIIHIEETDSTNRWLKENGEGNMVVVADYQTAGLERAVAQTVGRVNGART